MLYEQKGDSNTVLKYWLIIITTSKVISVSSLDFYVYGHGTRYNINSFRYAMKGILLFLFVVDTGTPLSLSSFNNDRHCSYPIHVVANYTEIHIKSTCTWYDLDSCCVLVYNGAKRV